MRSGLRPLTTVEILDAAWLLLRRNWSSLYACSTVGTLPVALIVLLYFRWLGTIVEGTESDVFYRGTALWALGMTLAWTLNGVARGAVALLALGEARGDPLSPGTAWRGAGRQAAGCAFVALFSFAAVWLGSLFLLVPGLLMSWAWWVARPALLSEERPFAAALRRSWRLTDGYRAKSLGLWLLFVGLVLVGLLNLHLGLRFLADTAAGMLGIDTSGLQRQFVLKNQIYTTLLLTLVFVLLDPLKTAAEVVLYLDLRIRREGADLQERLRVLRAGLAAALALMLLTPTVAGAIPAEQYLARVRSLCRQVESAPSPDRVEPALVGRLRSETVDLPGGQKVSVENAWLGEGMEAWRASRDRTPLIRRLEALERSLTGSGSTAPPPSLDTKQALQQILAEPEFQPLAERPELRDLAKRLTPKTANWWKSFWDWLGKMLFKPFQPKVKLPDPPQGPGVPKEVFYVILGLGALVLLGFIIKWLIERPVREEAPVAGRAGAAAPLEASATENALDHSVDEWELFAQEWLSRGDVRQAIRALYLATLVHLHRERRIEYNRAFTNWVYVRRFQGPAEEQGTLRGLTQIFDEVWYGERPCGEEHYRTFERDVRALGTPAPVAGGARA